MKKKILNLFLMMGLLFGATQSHAQYDSFGSFFSGYGAGDFGGGLLGNAYGAPQNVGLGPLIGAGATSLYNAYTSPSGQFDYGGFGMNLAVGALTYSVDTIGLGILGYSLSGPAMLLGGPVTFGVGAAAATYTLYNSPTANSFNSVNFWNNNVWNAMGDISPGGGFESYESPPSFSYDYGFEGG